MHTYEQDSETGLSMNTYFISQNNMFGKSDDENSS